MKNLKFSDLLAIIFNLLVIAAGVYLLFDLNVVIWIIAAVILLRGLMLVVGFMRDKEYRNFWDLIAGIISFIFGIFMFFGDSEDKIMGLFAINVFVAIWFFTVGLLHILGGMRIKQLQLSGKSGALWFLTVIGGVVMIVVGIALLMYPELLIGVAAAIGLIISIALIVAGLIGGGLCIYRIRNKDEF